MENQAPQMTPEMYAELQAQQEQPAPVETQAPAQQEPQQVQQQPAPATPPEDDVAQAKELLGVSEMQEQIKAMQADRVKESMSSKYPDIPYELVEKEIEKVAKINPAFADSMRTTQEGMDMAYRSAQALIQPKEKPDNLTDGESGGGQGENLDEMVGKGEADDYNLGKFILGN
jgi:hypothetical protein